MNWADRIAIRKAYQNFSPRLAGGFRCSPYDLGIDWIDKMTPIEETVWAEIRYLGLPFYPQFPVGPFFVDFADPERKVAIEVDSVQWHQDKAKDEKREKIIRGLGWNVYRLLSRELDAVHGRLIEIAKGERT